jgi:RNA polymerase sigma-70 factor (ECF subfamily)
MSGIDERQILPLLQNAETQKDAFSEIVKAYSEKLYWVARRMVLTHDDANDVLQNVFIKAWLNIESFKGESMLSTWLYKIAVNESITFLNKQRSHHDISIDDTDTFLLSKMESDSYFDGDEMQKQFQQALLTLPEKQRLVFNMKYFDEMKYEEISEVLGTSVGALKASYHHAVQKIKDFLSVND